MLCPEAKDASFCLGAWLPQRTHQIWSV